MIKRQKRNKSARAFNKGYQSGLQGRSKDICPYGNPNDTRQSWLSGWREGRCDNWDGLTGVSSVSQLSEKHRI
ncbi:Ribosome modulation factor [invertebrate metagenome]|uniref:Ribosome modulation factor n=1 Tax=invertebrate metagenome TaxID=1711999 RepID=A0A2H9T500_9ZZZZ